MNKALITGELGVQESNSPIFTLSVASRLSEIPAHSIRQYIDMGLLIPFKLESGRNLFSQNDISRLRSIQVLIHKQGLNFAGIRTLMGMVPCWAIRKCPESDKESCEASRDSFQPCWEASEKGKLCKNENCRDCKVYQSLDSETGIKPLLNNLL